ncbi:MAG TPA: hypothetical protein ENO23_08390, partial [Alphaproteobacteria bacterium]|nr:hypothetical protein [Alphaproteobacteria bacterium]
MTQAGDAPPGDRARASVLVRVGVEDAFRVFTEEIDRWWRRGYAYRVAGTRRGIICLEPKVGGRLFESFEDDDGETRVVETGRVTEWAPPSRLVFEWRAANFAPGEKTEVEVLFAPASRGTLVTVTHRGWSAIRPDHPARHGKETVAFVRMMA